MNQNVLILGLHRVGFPPPNAKIRGLFVSPKLLSFELWLLEKLGYRFATLKDAMLDPSGKTAVITFDDGYEDNYIDGLPVLDSYNAPATIFVVTADVGKKDVCWEEAGEQLPADMIDWEMLAELQRKGWEVGSHSHQHIHLDRRRSVDQESLICHSVFAIEERLGTVPISFAYPYGRFDENTKTILRRFGIRFAVTTEAPDRASRAASEDLLELKRLSLGGRRFYHYARVLFRTLAIVGFGESFRTVFREAGTRFVPVIAKRFGR